MRYMGNHLFKIVVKHNLSNNNAGQGRSWHKSAKDRKDFDRKIADSMVVTYEDSKVYAAPFADTLSGTQLTDLLVLVVTRVLGKNQRLWDSDSVLRGSSKQLIDAIVATGLVADDSPKHIALCIGQQDNSRREDGPLIEIDFYEAINGNLPIKPNEAVDSPS